MIRLSNWLHKDMLVYHIFIHTCVVSSLLYSMHVPYSKVSTQLSWGKCTAHHSKNMLPTQCEIIWKTTKMWFVIFCFAMIRSHIYQAMLIRWNGSRVQGVTDGVIISVQISQRSLKVDSCALCVCVFKVIWYTTMVMWMSIYIIRCDTLH